VKTPNEKYENDNSYRQLVDMLTALIHQAEFTPSEIREACMLACIRNESYRRIRPVVITAEAARAMEVLETEFLTRRNF
jgi:hypothetical protein